MATLALVKGNVRANNLFHREYYQGGGRWKHFSPPWYNCELFADLNGMKGKTKEKHPAYWTLHYSKTR